MLRPMLWILLTFLTLGAAAPARADDAADGLNRKFVPATWKKLSLGDRQAAVAAKGLRSELKDVILLLKTAKFQSRMHEKSREAWESEEAAWASKTAKFEGPVEKRRRRAYFTGEKVAIAGEVKAWLGTKKSKGAMYDAKDDIEKLYRAMLKEKWLPVRMIQAAARIAARLEDEERADGARRLMKAVDRLRGVSRAYGIRMLARIQAPEVDPWLLAHAAGRDLPAVSAASTNLGTRRSASGIEALKTQLSAPRWQVRASAIAGLTTVRNVGTVDAMFAQLGKEKGVLGDHYLRAFEKMFGAGRAANPAAWASWWRTNREAYTAQWKEGKDAQPSANASRAAPPEGSSTSFYGIPTTSRHIIFVVDMSGSMKKAVTGRDSRFVVAKKELAKAIGTLHEDLADDAGPGSFNIVVYGTNVDVYRPDGMVIATRAAKKKALAWVEKTCIPVGKTRSYDALAAAFAIAEKANARSPGRTAADTIYFMTDAGKPNRGKFLSTSLVVYGVSLLNYGRHITIHTVGVGTSIDEGMLFDLARQNGGTVVGR